MCLQESLKDIAQKLKRYRPAATVLEADVAPARRGEGAGGQAGPGMTASTSPADFQEVMREKRKHHSGAIKVSSCFCQALFHSNSLFPAWRMFSSPFYFPLPGISRT